MFKYIILLVIASSLCYRLHAEKILFEKVQITGIENPVSFALSLDGLKLIILDRPSKGLPTVKQASRLKKETAWSAAIVIPALNKFIDKTTIIDGLFISHDGSKLFFAANFPGSRGGMDIYYCTLKNGIWSEPQNLGTPINTEIDENYPSLSGNNRNFYFTRKIVLKKLEDFSCGEILMSVLDSTSSIWLKPEKLNTEINAGGISCAKILDDNNTLFYSRLNDDKYKWDIFWAKHFGEEHWYLPIRIDTICSKESETCPVFCKPEGKLYFIINEGSDIKPNGTIYKATIDPKFTPDKTIKVNGTVWDTYNKKPIKAHILITDPVYGKIRNYQQSDSISGKWEALLNTSNSYVFHVWRYRYSHQYELLPVEKSESDRTIDFKIFPVSKVTINVYDQESLSPLEASISASDKNQTAIAIDPQNLGAGQKQFQLPLGRDFTVKTDLKDFYPNMLNLGLSTIVLFDHFVRDIEMKPVLRKIEFYVTSSENDSAIVANIDMTEQQKGTHFTPEQVAGQAGLSSITVREGTKYGIDVRGPKGFAFKHTELDLDQDRDIKRVSIQLTKLNRKVAIKLNNINFEFNSADLIESSYEELNRLIQLMKDNSDIKVEILAHTDDLGTDEYNIKLSDKRARSVLQYLVYKGIPEERLISNGYGETIPLVPNTSDENRALNRRVEMKIIGFVTETVNPESKEE
ncbi:MAG: OmpA family protein [Prolixibacteraceae bacterium]|nr:OmpA family protein [Prolixibacteraceae bacterium]